MSPVALTFDDGPDPEWTPQVLGALAETGVTATFFVVAEQIAGPAGPALLSAIMEAGHDVQPHCTRHVRHAELDLDELREDITRVLAVLAAHGAAEPSRWRPPYGELHPQNSARVAAEVGLAITLWTDDPRDYAGTPAAQMVSGLGSLNEDSVILLHDSRRYTQRTDSAANTVELIDPLVRLIRARGYEAGPLP